MGLQAKPANFLRCFLASVSPPGIVEEVGEAILAEQPCITLELKDIQLAIKEAGINTSEIQSIAQVAALANSKPNLGTARYFIGLADARQLCCQLIHELANTDDRIAKRLEEVIKPAIQEAAIEDGQSDPYEDDTNEMHPL